jgi:ParB family chromosome partitioning protein
MLRLDQIEIPARARPYSATVVSDLKRSIEQLGLQSAPTVVDREGRFILVAGQNRIEALRLLKIESIPVRVVDFDDREARLWAISENLHRAELTVQQRAEQVAEYARLVEENREAAAQTAQIANPVLPDRRKAKPMRQGSGAACGDLGYTEGGKPAQVAQVSGGRGKTGGDAQAARDLGISRDEVRRAKTIARLSPEAKVAAARTGLDDVQSALLGAAKAPTPGEQVAAIERSADQRAKPRLHRAPPLRNLENISGGELAGWIKITTPRDRPQVIQVLRTAADILTME